MKSRVAWVLCLLAMTASSLFAAVISVPVPTVNATFEETDVGQLIQIPDFSTISSPGNPALPYKDIHLILPPNVDTASISATLTNCSHTLLSSGYDIAPAPPAVTVVDGVEVTDWGAGKEIVDGRNTLVYDSNSYFPSNNLELIGTGDLRQWRIATIRYYPYRYNPVSKRLEAVIGGNLELTYEVKTMGAALLGSPSDVLLDQVKGLAANFDEARSWYLPAAQTDSLSATSLPQGTGYIIVTTSAIVSGSTKLQAFINHKVNRGFTVTVATEAQWGGGTGNTAADKIRAYLKANYAVKNAKYVLLIGDPHPSTGAVPMKMLWPRHYGSSYPDAPSDYYYADLTGNWDRDGDGYYGEQVDDFGSGGIDALPEVIVGRIPFYGNFSDLDSILQKIINYEAGSIGGAWVRNVLVSMEPSDSSTPGYQLGEAIKSAAADPAGFGTKRVYDETYGLNPQPDYVPCNYANVASAWSQHAGFHFWWTHGSETLAADIMTSSGCDALDDNYPSFVFQCSCLNGYPERSDNLGYSLLRRGAISTVAATRVSWYYPGQTVYTGTDSNAGMTYVYAVKIVRDHMPCGDAFYEMMTQIPNGIWANHCVFNLYGDPSVAYAAGPVIMHSQLPDTDNDVSPYEVSASVSVNSPLALGSPVIKWNTNGGQTFSTASMISAGGANYSGCIPAQSLGATVYYYVTASDAQGRTGSSPPGAPSVLHSFHIRQDTQPPVIQHAPLADTGDTAGPYTVKATVTDDCGISSVKLRYTINGSAEAELPMVSKGSGLYEASIPGPTSSGDLIGYYILATDTSKAAKTTRWPESGYSSFSVSKLRVAIYDSAAIPSYFVGGNRNLWSAISDILSQDSRRRFDVSVVASLTSTDLAGKDVIVLPDNGVATSDMQSVANWFVPGRTIVTMDSSASYAAYSGYLWPSSTGSTNYGILWDQGAGVNDQKIVLSDPATSSYSVGQVISSRGYGAQFFVDKLPTDAKVLSVSNNNPNRAYSVYRDVPGKGRIIALGPFIPVESGLDELIRDAVAARGAAGKTLRVTSPAGGEMFCVGDTVRVTFTALGSWGASDKVKLEYTTGSTWLPVPGASSIAYSLGQFDWPTSGLTGSHSYRVRVSAVDGSASDTSDYPFALLQLMNIAQAKFVADGSAIVLSDKVVISNLEGQCYVGEPDRSAGIRVTCGQGLGLFSHVTLSGVMGTVNGERVLNVVNVQNVGAASTMKPLVISTRSLGGGAFGMQPPVMEYRQGSSSPVAVFGVNNVGLLVRVAGVVTSVGDGFFYVDDGAGCKDGTGATGVRVFCGGVNMPSVGSHVTLTAVSSTLYSSGNPFRALVLPVAGQLQVID